MTVFGEFFGQQKITWRYIFVLKHYTWVKRNWKFSWYFADVLPVTGRYDGWFVKRINAVSQNRNSCVLYCTIVPTSFILFPRIFVKESTNESRVQFSSVVQVSSNLTRETTVSEFAERSKRQLVSRHVRHFEDQCQDRDKKRAYGLHTTTNVPETKKGYYNTQHAWRPCIFLLFFLPLLCHCLPTGESVTADVYSTWCAVGGIRMCHDPIGFELRS